MENALLAPTFNAPVIGEHINNQNNYRYKIASVLKSGHFGTVYLGYDIFEVPYAIKVFKPSGTYEEVRIRWQEEAGKLRELFHPHIAYMHDVFEYKYAFYIVMELLGSPLSHYVTATPMLSDEKMIEIARQILFGMSFIHWHNIVHLWFSAPLKYRVSFGKILVRAKFCQHSQALFGRDAAMPQHVVFRS